MTAFHPFQASPGDDTYRWVDASITAGTSRALNVCFERGDGNDVPLGHAQRPRWRGAIHMGGLVVAVPAVSALLMRSSSDTQTRLSVGTYAVGLCLMLAASTTYHRWVHRLQARCAWRRIDHAAIFAAIAGSSTPIVTAALPGATGVSLVGAIWSSAIVGACCKLSRWRGGDRAGTAMYAVTIMLSAAAAPSLPAREGIAPAAFVIGGGVVYLLGAACFARRWPTLRPTVFSYHEVWHVFTVIAASAQFIAIWMLTVR